MSVTINIAVDDVVIQAATYTKIELERATSPTGAFAEITEIALDAVDPVAYTYSYVDAGGTLSHWYKYRFSNADSSVRSDYCAPFQADGVTRARIRGGLYSKQGAIQELGIGFTFLGTKVAGSETTALDSTNRRIKNSILTTNYRRNNIVHQITPGNSARYEWGYVSIHDPTNGRLTITPAFSANMGINDTFELYTVSDPDEVNGAIQDAMARMYIAERRPILGDGETYDFPLAGLVGLFSKKQVANLYFRDTSSVKDNLWTTGGRTAEVVEDNGVLTLHLNSAPATGTILYLEYAKQAQPLWDDDSVSPVSLDLAIKLTIDEMLKRLAKSGKGSSEDRSAWYERRVDPAFQMEINQLLETHKPQLNWNISLQGRQSYPAYVGGRYDNRRDAVDWRQ